MTAAPETIEARSVETGETRRLDVARVSRDEARLTRLLREHPLPFGLAREIVRSANDAIELLLPAASRPALVLEGSGATCRMEPGDTQLEWEAGEGQHGFDVHRGRNGARLVRAGNAVVTRNGWPIPNRVPVSLLDGDAIEAGGATWRARYEPQPARPVLECGPTRRAAAPGAGAVAVAFELVPSGERIEFHVDRATARAVADVVLGGDGSSPFEPSMLGEIETGLVEWVVARAAHEIGAALFGGSESLVAAPGSGTCDLWCATPMRVGRFNGAVWLGATEGALATASSHLREVTRRRLVARSAVSRIAVTVAARLPLGRVSVAELSTIAAGDTLVARLTRATLAPHLNARGLLAVVGTDRHAVSARFELHGAVLHATVGPPSTTEWSQEMSQPVSLGAEGADQPFESVIDELTVGVSVEIARRRMSLGELLAVEAGDVIEMNAPVAAGVTLVIDGTPFARGELVDVEGSLGVRVVALGSGR